MKTTCRARALFRLILFPLLLVVSSCLLLSCVRTDSPSLPTKAAAGVLDLRNWNPFIKTGLSGQWEYYPQQMISPSILNTPAPADTKRFTEVPGAWKDVRHGFATYRLRVLFPADRSALAVRISTVSTAFRLYADGALIASAGTAGESASSAVPAYAPQIVSLGSSGPETDFVLQVSNYHYRKGGPWRTIWIGKESVLRKENELSSFYTIFLIGAIFVMGGYHLVLFAFRRNEKQFLYFALFCFCISVRALATGEYLIAQVFPSMSFTYLIRAELLSFCFAVAAMTRFVRVLFPYESSRAVSRIFVTAPLLLALGICILPVRIFSWEVYLMYPLLVSAILWYSLIVIRAVVRKRQGSVLFLIGGTVLALACINDMLYSSFIVRTGNFVDAGLLFFIFMQGIVLSHQFTIAFSSVEKISARLSLLNAELEHRVEERTGELQKAYETIKDISIRDPLTKCYNRRFIDEQLPKEIERALRYDHPLSVIICDIDFFKAVNDSFGHLAGDKVLIEFSCLMENSLRKNIDWCGRFGGEEFLIVLPETSQDGAVIIADRIREGCLSLEVPFENNRIRFTASFGVSGLDDEPSEIGSMQEIIFHKADKALYRAKREGRNRVVKG